MNLDHLYTRDAIEQSIEGQVAIVDSQDLIDSHWDDRAAENQINDEPKVSLQGVMKDTISGLADNFTGDYTFFRQTCIATVKAKYPNHSAQTYASTYTVAYNALIQLGKKLPSAVLKISE